MKILHIAPHVGGGVGSVLKGFFGLCKDHNVANSLICLDYCESNFEDLSAVETKRHGVSWSPSAKEILGNEINSVDVVLLHYWNHPLVAKFCAEHSIPRERMVIWCHNSGLFEPHILPAFLCDISDKVVFTSSCSYGATNLATRLQKTSEKFAVIHSTRDLDEFLRAGLSRSRKRPLKNLLYVGTVSASKLHPEAAKIFADLANEGFSVRVVGGPDEEELVQAVSTHGGEIEVFGEVQDVIPFLEDADLFIYPLRPDHYGTGEQVMLEAMAAGLPVLAFDNPAERAILGQGGGLLLSETRDFVAAANRLRFDQSGSLKLLSMSAVDRVKTAFDASLMVNELLDILFGISKRSFSDICSKPLSSFPGVTLDEFILFTLHSFFDGQAIVFGYQECLRSLEDVVFEKIRPVLRDRDLVTKWCALSKGSPFHYLRYFPDNERLQSLCQRITAERGVDGFL